MAALDPRIGVATLWLAAFGALALVIGWETDWGRRVKRAEDLPAAKAAPVTVALLPDYALAGGIEARRETVERPAFVPTRRPSPPPPAQEPPKPRLQRGQFVLTGTAIVDQQAVAFLRETATGKSRTVRKGDVVNGMTVTEVVPDRIMLAMGDETEGLALRVATNPRPTVQPPPPGQPGQPGAPGAPAPPVPGQPAVAVGTQTVPAAGQPPAAVAAPGLPQGDPAAAQSLLERRRAARAAQAAAEAAATQAGGNPAAAQPASPAGDWAEVYRRMQQPRR